jgi:hypothetical protein
MHLSRGLTLGWLMIHGVACGGRVQNDRSQDGQSIEADDPEPKGEGALALPAASALPGASAEPSPPRDPVLDNELLAPNVTSVEQPSYFKSADDAGAAQATLLSTGDGGTSLEGSGDLTVLLVFDKSSSMLFDWHGVTRWQVANESLRAALDGILDQLTIGVIRFPLGAGCEVKPLTDPEQIAFTTGRDFVAQWQDMEHRLESLGTPLAAALEQANAALGAARESAAADERFRVVLVTDGEPNCGDDLTSMVARVSGWHEQGVETLIIGLPGSTTAASTLNALAQAGGTGAVRATEDEAVLNEELSKAVR